MSYNDKEYQAAYLTGGTTAQLFTGRGTVHAVLVGTTSSGAVTLFDMVNPGLLVNTGTVALLKASIAENSYNLDGAVANGLYVTYPAAGTYTVLWTK